MSKSSLFVFLTLSILLFFFTPGVVAAVLPQTMAPPVETPQLSPTQCHLARTQCPSLQLTGHQLDNDVDPQLLELRRQYEHNLDRLKVYVSRIVDLLKTQPEARPLITLCAEMGDPLTDEAMFGNAHNPAATPSPSTPAPPTTTTTTQKTETTTEQKKTETTKEEMTTAMITKKTEAESSTSRPATTAPTAAVTTMTTSISSEIVSSTIEMHSPVITEANGTQEPTTTKETPEPTTTKKTPELTTTTKETPEPPTTTTSATTKGTPEPTTTKEIPEPITTTTTTTTKETPEPTTTTTKTPEPTTRTGSPEPTTTTTPALPTTITPEPITTGTPAPTITTTTTRTETPYTTKTKTPVPLTTGTPEPTTVISGPATTETTQSTATTLTVQPPTTTPQTQANTTASSTESPSTHFVSKVSDPSAPVFTENSSNTSSLAATATTSTAAPTTTPTDTAAPAAAETTTTLGMTTTSSTTTSTTASTTLAAQCLVSPWSEWSRPYGFGVQSRQREIVHPGFSCPEGGQLIELRPFEQTGWTLTQLSQNYTLVGDNFDRDFLRAMDGPTDILVILDAPGKDDPDALTNIKNAVKEMLGLFCGEFGDQLTHNRFSLITYSTLTSGFLQDAQTLPRLMGMVDNIFPMDGATCTTHALEQALIHFKPAFGARQNARHVTLLITTSTSNCLNTYDGEDANGNHNIDRLAEELRKVSEVYAMGVGVAENPLAREEVQKIVTDSDHKHIFSLSSYADFDNMMMSVKEGRNGATC